MTLDEFRSIEWDVSWSGGKDSTATIILCHIYGIPIKNINYVRMMFDDNTAATLPIMYEFVERAIKVFISWGYNVNVINSEQTAFQIASKVYKRSKYPGKNGKLYGVSAFCRGHCRLQGVKQRTVEHHIDNSSYQLIGYAVDELERLKRLGGKKYSILSYLGYTEKDAKELCKKYGLLSPLYDLGFPRDGCFFCPNAGAKEREYLIKNRPDLVSKIKMLIDMCDYDLSPIETSNNWVSQFNKRKEFKTMELMTTTREMPIYSNKELRKATEKVFKIGETVRKCAFETAFIMAKVEETECYKDDGFNNVHEWAMQTFGFKKSASYTLLRVGKEYTRAITDENGKVRGYGSNLLPEDTEKDFTTTQIEKMLPAGYEVALQLVDDEEITPEMTCKEIEKVIKTYTNPETEEPETEVDGQTEIVETVLVHDDNGCTYEIPRVILEQYKVE